MFHVISFTRSLLILLYPVLWLADHDWGDYCLDGFDNNGRRTISCVSNSKGKRKLDPQAGTSNRKRGRTQLGNFQVEYSVKIDHDMTEASVAAIFESE